MSEPTVVTEPEIVHQGRYRLYKNPDGGLHIVYKKDDAEAEEHFEMPGAIVIMGEQMAQGKLNPMDAMKSIAKLAAGMRH